MLNPFKKFPVKIKFGKLFLYWLAFFIIGVLLMTLLNSLFPSFQESSNQISENFCSPVNIITAALAPILETLIFMIIPYYFFKKKKIALIIGISIWALLHLLSGNFPIFIYISIMGYFYYRCLEIGRWKFVILVHSIVNLFSIISCFT